MKKQSFIFVIALLFAAPLTKAQTGEFYTTFGSEMIFSFASIDDNGKETGGVLRWTPVINLQTMVNYDPAKSFGLFSGIGVRNVGFIYDDYTDPETGDVVKKKFRNYNIGIPVGIKIGNVERLFVYGGYEIEFPLAYKEKTFQNEIKSKFTVWFSKRVPTFYHTFIAGIEFPYGANLKFKYYLTNFHNKDYISTVNGVQYKPYQNLNANVFYIALSFNLFKNKELYYKEERKTEGKYSAL
jgi:hypothetical protein